MGLSEPQIGLLLTLTLIGDTAISLWITTTADRVGRRRMLSVGAGLMLLAGLLFASTNDFALLLLAATKCTLGSRRLDKFPLLMVYYPRNRLRNRLAKRFARCRLWLPSAMWHARLACR